MAKNKQEIKDEVKMRMAIYNFQNELNEEKSLFERKESIFMRKKRIIATVCASFILISGIVVATAINKGKNKNRGLGEGVQTAIENGYIAEPQTKFINRKDVGVNVTIENFFMDEMNLSVKFNVGFDDNATSVINLEKARDIQLNDLIVRDEENRIIYASPMSEESFEKYCKEHNLNYIYGEYNENYMNNGLNSFIETKEKKSAKIIYNMYADGMPKSKRLYFSFNTIKIIETYAGNEKEYLIDGSWDVEIEVPENMYNREYEYYKLLSCDSDDFKIYEAKVSETGFEIGVIISNIEKPVKIENPENKDYYNVKLYGEEYIITNNDEYNDLINPIQITKFNYADGENGKASYVQNENGKKYYCVLNPSRKAKNSFINGNKFDFYDTFEMTKYEATDKIKIILYYYGKPVTIQLQKIK